MGALVLVLLPLFAAGCDDDAQPEATASAPLSQGPSVQHLTWLDERDDTTPERWLASRAAKSDLAENDPAVAAMRDSLAAAATRFRDKPRMIANRAVQLEEMLAKEGIAEPAPELVSVLTSAAESALPLEGFGAMCQHYFYLRKQGLDRDAALDQLKRQAALSPSSPHAGQITPTNGVC